MSEPAFDQLRTKEQLGYIVFTGLKRLNQQYLSLHIIVQSSHKDADYLDNRIEAFLQVYRDQLIALSEETFKENVNAVIEKLVEKPKNIEEVIFYVAMRCILSSFQIISYHLYIFICAYIIAYRSAINCGQR